MARSATAKRDPRIDAYITKAAPFAKPIITHVREVVHEACPEIVETLKWGHPSFDHHGIVCGVAAFKAHCVLSFWKAALLGDAALLQRQVASVADLPGRRDFVRLVKQAAKLNEDGVTVPEEPRKRPSETRPLDVPDVLTNALRKNKKAQTTFDAFSHTNKKDYVDWITDAKSDDTRQKRLEQAIEWMAEGKPRNWKYQKK
ncbi:MAG TPA: YdeI/OmpD-associated family protein [Vicinamibacterales bacterium]|jgi:uncharacterized protein YdeI (YjbR/CyaY-like superfamily)